MSNMPHITPDFRHQKFEWKKLKQSERSGVLMILGAAALIILLRIGLSWFGGETPIVAGENTLGYLTNVFTEMLSVGVTVLILDRLAEMREERRLKERLIREAASRSNERAKAAIDDLRHYGRHQEWLTGEDGLLKEKDLSGANLVEASLESANLQGAILKRTSLQEAKRQKWRRQIYRGRKYRERICKRHGWLKRIYRMRI